MKHTEQPRAGTAHSGRGAGWLIIFALALSSVPAPSAAQQQGAQPAVEEWGDEFDGSQLDDSKWEVYTFDGGGGAKIEVKDKQLQMRGAGTSRSGIRSKPMFHSDRFYVEATLAKVGERLAQPGEAGFPPGFGIVTVLFGGTSTNRLEWILRSDGTFEAWQSQDGRMIRLDSGNLATKEKNPKLGIARRGDQVYFMLNREIGLERTIRGLSPEFKVMLYGFGATENHWDSIFVQTMKQ